MMKNLAAKKTSSPNNPYLDSQKQFNSREKELRLELNYWRIGSLLCLILALAGVGGAIHIGQQSKYIPYVVEVDDLGQYAKVGIVQATSPADPRIIKTVVTNFIHDARVVTPDIALQQRAINSVYNHLQASQPATNKANEFYRSEESNPFERAAKVMVSTKIESVIPQTPETWQIDWVETVRDRQGVQQGIKRMRAMVHVQVAGHTPDASEETIQKNPLGIYIHDFSWTQRL